LYRQTKHKIRDKRESIVDTKQNGKGKKQAVLIN